MTPAQHSITGLLLAGGRGQRMGGADKGLLLLHGMPMIEHALRRLRPQVDHVLISANRNLDAYSGFDAEVIADADPASYLGPLAGIARALRHCGTPWLLCAPCDAPHLPSDLGARLLEGAEAAHAPGAVARCEGLRQPVFCLLRPELVDSLDDYLGSGGRRVGHWSAAAGCVDVDFDDPRGFINVNAPDELRGLQSADPCHRML